MANIQDARDILQGLSDIDRQNFITKFKMLDTDEKRQIAIDRLVEKLGKSFMESKAPVFGATQVIPKSPVGALGRFRLATGTPEGRRQILQRQFGEVYGQPKREIVKTPLGYQAINPRGFDIGDIPEFAVDIPTIAGGIGGAIIGAPSIVGSAGMAGLGAFAGENIKNIIGKIIGSRPDTKEVQDVSSALKEGAKVGALQLAFGIGGKVLGKTFGAIGNISKSSERILQRIGNINQRTSSWIKDRLKYVKAKDIFTKEKISPDYANTILNPRIQAGYLKSIQSYSDDTAKLLKELNVSDDTVNVLKLKGYNTIKQTQSSVSSNNIIDDIYKGFENKRNIADEAYKKAMGSFKGTIDSSSFYTKLQKVLRDKGFVDLTGNPTTRFKGGIDPVYDELTSLYLDMRPTLTGRGKIITGKIMSKNDFNLFRDKLSRLLKDRPSDISVMEIKNSLYSSAEKSGMIGIKTARDLEVKAFKAEQDLFLKGLINKNKINNINRLSTQELNKLKEIEKYIDKNFIDDAKNISAANELDSVLEKQLNPKNIETLFNSAQNEQKTYTLNYLKKINDTMPKDYKFFRDFQDYLINMDFEDIGLYTSQAGLRRFGVEQAVKGFYKFGIPASKKMEQLSKTLEPTINKMKGFGKIGILVAPSFINKMQE